MSSRGEPPMDQPDPGEEQALRAGTARSDPADTYTRSSMESHTVAAGRRDQLDAPDAGGLSAPAALETPDADPGMSMALLSAHEQERSRLAEELHDGPAQALANAIFQTQLVDRAVRDDPGAARAELAALREMLERELDTLRGYINQLRPALDEAEGLDDALRDGASAVSQRTGLQIEVRLVAPTAHLHAAARTVVLRVAQEALRNVAKHARATRAWLSTSETSGADGTAYWVLEVGDDGRGFDYENVAAHPNRRHFGLRFMRERADLLGSELSFETSPAAGTVVRLSIATGEERS